MIIHTTLEKFSKTESSVYSLHFPISEEAGKAFIDGDNRRVTCLINGQKTIRAGLMPMKDYWYILCNHALQKELELKVGEKVELILEKDLSKYGMEIPEELQVMLDQEGEAAEIFERLTAGKQRSLIYLVAKVKNTNSRLNKALAIIHHLKESQGKLDGKRLNELIKFYNQQGKLR